MTAENFCYWMQGAFEITNLQALTPEQLELIGAHLQLVFTYDTDEDTEAMQFCRQIEPLLSYFEEKGMTEAQTSMIQKTLNKVFIHEIDPSQGDAEMQEKLNKIHQLGKPGKIKGSVQRC